MSISASLASFEWRDVKVNLIDTPGEPRFVADALGALRVCESAVFVVNGVMGVEVSTQRLWQRAAELGVARLVYVNMLDRERADFFRTLDVAQGRLRPARRRDRDPDRLRARAPRRDRPRRHEGLRVRRRPSTASEIPIPDDLADQAQEYREKLMDEVAENSEALMERYLEGEEISHDEIVTALEDGTDHGHIFPVTCGVATTRLGADRLLDAIVDDLPSPVQHGGARGRGDDARADRGRRDVRLRLQDPRRPVRRAASTSSASTRASMTHDTQVLNTRTHNKERIGQLLEPRGKDVEPRRRVRPGRHRRGRQAQGDARGRLARRARPADPHAGDQAPGPGDGLPHRAEGQGRRGQGLHRAAAAAGGGPDDRPAPRRRRRASRSSPGCRRSTSR